ncbi:hypothetical protein GCM10010360_46210 [Streptomyces nogalater]
MVSTGTSTSTPPPSEPTSTPREPATSRCCYTRGSDYNDGKHHTNVWYRGVVIDDSTNRTFYDVYSWGGNVNTPHDPPAGLGRC